MSDLRPLERCGAALALVLAVLSGGAALAAEGCLEGAAEVHLAEIVDARSLRLDDGRVLRLAGIEPFDLLRPDLGDAKPALRRRLSQLAEAAPLSALLTSSDTDRYGRHPAMIAASGTLMQESLAGEGLAVAFAGGDALPCFDRVLAAEDAARRSGRGFWTGEPLPAAAPEALRPRIGLFTIFEGEVLSVGKRSTRTYLNFGTYWSEDVTVEIDARDRGAFGGEPELAALAGRRLRVRGYLEEKAGPMMPVRSPMQLEILQQDE